MIDTERGLAPGEIAAAISQRRQPMLLQHSPVFAEFCREWSLERLREKLQGRAPIVRAVRGNRETQRTSFEHLLLDVFLGRLLDRAASPEPLYLKEFALEQLAAELPVQLDQPSYLGGHRNFSSAWIGGGATSTGTHFDIFDNLLFQVQGHKTIYLAPPNAIARSGYSAKYDFCARIARIQLSRDASALSRRIELRGGDLLYIPRGWWHQIENREPSFTISGFHASLARLAWRGGAEGLRHMFHCLTPFKSQCTCHEKQ